MSDSDTDAKFPTRHRWTARETLAWCWKDHAECSPTNWRDEKYTVDPKMRRVTVECSCGSILSCVANSNQMNRIREGFRNVAPAAS